ncbi:PQQ-dependent sugar dehydrogenase [Candidatus Woesearchaeota archaeon]|nr:PQQ-dependent sugar dehydrogenase [Candidatus Woesearchaeota archaeon]
MNYAPQETLDAWQKTLAFLEKNLGGKRVAPKDSKMEIVARNLDTPWAMDFLPTGQLIFTERPGRVNVIENGVATVVGEIPVNEEAEAGLLGIAVDPEFKQNQFVYLYYTHENKNRVSRFQLEWTLKDEIVLIDDIPFARFHNGGRIKFGPDGKLYITTGDATELSSAQDITSLAGKILRLNKDGTIPEDNPSRNEVYSYGHRNPQGLAWHDATRQLVAAEHGPTRNDEINFIEKGKNYGWPQECTDKIEEINQPIRCYTEFTLAPGGIAFQGNALYIAGLRGTQLRKIVFTPDLTTILSEEEIFSDFGRIRDVVEHEGYIYFSTSNRDGRGLPAVEDDKIVRVKTEK